MPQTTFKIIKDSSFSNQIKSQYLYESIKTFDKLDCLTKCNKIMTSCPVVTFNHKTKLCEMYRINAANQESNYREIDTDKFINQNYVKQPYDLPTIGLSNYWQFNNNYLDMIGNAHMFGGTPLSRISFVKDRYGIDNSALYLNNAYLNLPNGTYISSDFTLTVWVKLISIKSFYGRLLSISNKSVNVDSIMFSIGSSSLSESTPYIFFQTPHLPFGNISNQLD